ncbi:5-dehydro-2-deoxygluconokinase [Amycolatopsis alkalitolerans]|uniref:5-dehydro-2-deoxygluconokinase n=1 Tax=Amycolatopsis alkalitolerans TaxID=2547244 RepID=A0A5C4M869_9PSEU|nr:5-dehydro-2-deoxygluconokinase [Amycolatopsis alkalitolerans]TNC27870.1 5-dehydro-2-deoxygluconokinase [Amycolatopsis alkalitolerans]
MTPQFDLVTMGRVGVDIYPLQTGAGLEDVTSFGKYLGGTATNVAVAAARYGRRSAVVTKTGADPFGRFVHRALQSYGVDDRFVGVSAHLPTPVTFCEIFPPDDFPLYFYRFPQAPDLDLHPSDVDLDAVRATKIFWVTATGLCQEPSRSTTLDALEARGRKAITVLDLDYRPMFWESREQAHEWVSRALDHVTIAVGNLDEAETAVATREPRDAAKALRDRGISLAVIKQGPRGVLAVDDSGEVEVPPLPVEVVNGLGAGDAFGGALCHGLLSGWDTEQVIRFANAAGAHVAGELACSDAMPTEEQVLERLNQNV